MNAKKTTIQANALLFSDLFCKGRFEVPWHQRDYDWKPDHVKELLLDIQDALIGKQNCYFLGSIMLVESGEGRWEVNDGQQRMVTISLVFAALSRYFSSMAKESQREGLALRMMFDLDPNQTWTSCNSSTYTPRIIPPKNNEMQYKQMIRGNTIGSNGLLTKAWKEIDNFFSLMKPKQLEDYFDFLMQKLEVVCLSVPPPPTTDPNAIYETINCRGKKLDDLDLIRNFIYSHFNVGADDERRRSVHESLEKIRVTLPAPTKASAFIRCFLQCKYGFLSKSNFYREARGAISDQRDKKTSASTSRADYIFDLTKQITSENSLGIFRAIINQDATFIRQFEIDSGTQNAKRNLKTFLRELKSYSITLPLIFSILRKYLEETDGRKRKRIAKIANKNISRLATFVVRTAFVAPKFEPSHFEKSFSDYAKHIMSERELPDAEFVAFLRDCDRPELNALDDSKFENNIAQNNMKGRDKIMQFLLGINNDLQADAGILNPNQCSVEHILPKSPEHWRGWTAFSPIEAKEYVHRIGNLTLMGQADNKPGAKFNKSFPKKLDVYKSSGFKITRELGSYDDWSPKIIEKRQKKMAKAAVRIWRFD